MNHSNEAATAGAMVMRSREGKTLRWGPKGTVRIIAGASTTDRSFSIVESTQPPGSGAPVHVHHGEAEAFYILDGTVQLTCGDETVTAHAGDFVYTPKNVPHKFVVGGHSPARMLMLFSRPGFETDCTIWYSYWLTLIRQDLVPRHGFEPRLTAPKAAVLPLDDRGE